MDTIVFPLLLQYLVFLYSSPKCTKKFVEQGGDILNAANEMPVDMSMIKATPDPEEWGTWVGRTLDNWKASFVERPKGAREGFKEMEEIRTNVLQLC